MEVAIDRHSNNKAIVIHQRIEMARTKTVTVVKSQINDDKNGPVHRSQTTTVAQDKMTMRLQEQLVEHSRAFEVPYTSH